MPCLTTSILRFPRDLTESRNESHLYEALSYVWGSQETPESISIDKHNLPVTANLYVALLPLENIRIAIEDESTNPSISEKSRKVILKLLKRLCLIRSITYLIRRAIFRPKYTTSPLGRLSLGELVDIYYNREATMDHDMRLIKFTLSKEVSIETFNERKIAIIKSKGYILSRVSLEDDIVYLLQGASKPTILRACEDHFTIIIIANWEKFLLNLQDRVGYETLVKINTLVLGYLKTSLNKVARFCDVALVLRELGEYKEAEKRKRIQGKDHQYTLSSVANLALTYIKISNCIPRDLKLGFSSLRKPKKLESMTSLTDRIRDNVQITEGDMVQVVRSFGKELMTLLLDLKRDNVPITEEVVKAAAGNEDHGWELIPLLLDQCSAEVKITEEVLKAAAGNWNSGKGVMALLLDRRGDEVKITKVWNSIGGDKEGWLNISRLYNAAKIRDVATVLLITSTIDVNAAANGNSKVVRLLLDHGTKLNYIDKDGRSPLSVAQSRR
ncbi:hypothetical protein V8E51_001118 [Hyaloscypha variabilis]